MKITEHILKISGVDYETNSNSYAIVYEGGIALVDCGYQEKQWNIMEQVLAGFGHSLSEVTHVFLTHGHFDHALNAVRVNALGAKLYTSAEDRILIEEGNPESEKLFDTPWISAKVDRVLQDGEVFEFPGDVKITAYSTPGHSKGSMSYLIEADGCKAVTSGDMFWTVPVPPLDAVDVEIGFMGSADANKEELIRSLEFLHDLDFSILLSGHYSIYRGENMKYVTGRAVEKAKLL